MPDGRRRLLRRAATDLEQPPVPQAALPRISARALLPLARHIRSMLAASNKEAVHADRPQSDPSASSAAGTIPPSPAVVGHVAPSVQTQLAQQLACLLQRVRDGEAGHADHAE